MKKISGSVLAVGATSAIVTSTLYKIGKKFRPKKFILMARNQEKLSSLASDMKIRFDCEVKTLVFEATDIQATANGIEKLLKEDLSIEVALLGHGVLPDNDLCGKDVKIMEKSFYVNGLSFALLLQNLVRYFKKTKKGSICVIGSVAGDRGRASNYYYGSAKAYVEKLTQGIRVELFDSDVQVLLVKPGFVDTPMTSSFKKSFLWVQPETVGKTIVKAIVTNKSVIYIPFFWGWIMFVIKLLPGFIFNRLKSL